MIKQGNTKFSKLTDVEIKTNEHLLWAVEQENISEVKYLLSRENSICPSQSIINKAFESAISHRSLPIIASFIQSDIKGLSPEQSTIDRLYREYAGDGEDIDVISLLETAVSSGEFCLQQRKNTESRKNRLYQTQTHYVVSFIEPDKVKEIDSRRLQHIKKLKSVVRTNVFAAILSDQRWINGFFVDCVDSHLKLVVRKLLTLPSGHDSLRPDQTTINEAFIRCVTRGYLSMAAMLSDSRILLIDGVMALQRGVDQQGFDEALRAVSEIDEEVSMQWLLRGSQGLSPSPAVVDEVYLSRCRRPTEAPIRLNPFLRLGRRVNRFAAEQKELRLQSIENITAVIAARSSEEVLAVIARERRVAAARLAHFQQMRHGAGGEIHSYSNTAIPDALRADLGAEQVPMDVNGDQLAGGGDNGRDGEEGNDDQGEEDDMGDRDAPPQPVHRPNTLNGAVMECIERRVGGIALTMEQITSRMSVLIDETFTTRERQTEAMRIVSDGMNERNERILGLTLNFLSDERFPPSAARVWIQGFLVESIVVNSCNPGAMERIVTGLRGVDDPELNRIFTAAEGPNLARIFLMGTFNIYYSEHDPISRAAARRNALNLARELVARGITGESSDVEAGAALTIYAMEAMTGYGVGDSFAMEVRRTVEVVTDMYDEFLQPFVREVLAQVVGETVSMEESDQDSGSGEQNGPTASESSVSST